MTAHITDHQGAQVMQTTLHDDLDEEGMALFADLELAAQRGEIVPFYQPRIGLVGNTLIGVEVLARWLHPTKGHISPGTFIPLAEKTGCMHVLTKSIFAQALHDIGQWARTGLRLQVSLNVSQEDFRKEDMGKIILDLAAGNGISASDILLEVTEKHLTQDASAYKSTLEGMRASGLRVSLDNFGNSELSREQLLALPIDEIKIGRAVVSRALSSEEARDMLANSLQLARFMNVGLVAEGVETSKAKTMLSEMGYLSAQGYYFARPMQASEFVKFVAGGTVCLSTQKDSSSGQDSRYNFPDITMTDNNKNALPKLRGGRILIVDDMATNRALLKAALASDAHEIVEAADGLSALEILKTDAFDCILLDQLMPGMSGLEVLKRIRVDHPLFAMPVIFVTSLYDTEVVLEALRHGADDYISKPFEFEVLHARVSAHILRKQLGDELRQAKEEADRANRAKSEYLSFITHELRTPLTGILGFSGLLESKLVDTADSDNVEFTKLITESGKHLLQLINQLLDLAKIEAREMKVDVAEFNASDILEFAGNTTQSLVKLAGNTLAIEIEGETGTMQSDQFRLQQVLLNLVGNAIKFTEQGRITLGLRRLSEKDGDWLVFTVRDTGIGMKPEECTNLFQPYTQANREIWKRYGGTGLGLAISQNITELLGGNITVDSEKGRGTVFTVMLPAVAPICE
jgi:signal transduction histidine kinase/EAL domain-containing protein (putative c-di-GMP-specific phosphodiesterase class I)